MTAEVPLNEPINKNSFLISGKYEYQKIEKKNLFIGIFGTK